MIDDDQNPSRPVPPGAFVPSSCKLCRGHGMRLARNLRTGEHVAFGCSCDRGIKAALPPWEKADPKKFELLEPGGADAKPEGQ